MRIELERVAGVLCAGRDQLHEGLRRHRRLARGLGTSGPVAIPPRRARTAPESLARSSEMIGH